LSLATNEVSPSDTKDSKPNSAESLVAIPSDSNSLSTSGTFERVPSLGPASFDQLHTPAVISPPKVLKAASSSGKTSIPLLLITIQLFIL